MWFFIVNKTFSVQPIVYGACDQDVSAKTLLEEPRLYNKGRLGTVGKLFFRIFDNKNLGL